MAAHGMQADVELRKLGGGGSGSMAAADVAGNWEMLQKTVRSHGARGA